VRTRRFTALAAILLGVVVGVAGGADRGEPFEVTVLCFPESLPLGTPLDVAVRVRNIAGQPVTVAFSQWDPPVVLEIQDDAGNKVDQCPELRTVWKRVARLSVLPASWSWQKYRVTCFKKPGTYHVQVVLRSSWVKPVVVVEGEEPWAGSAVSRSCNVRVVEPDGEDREAFDAFSGEPLPFLDREGVQGRLLVRFPSSTYAAYVVWDLQVKGVATRNAEHMADSLALGLTHQWNSVPGPAGSWRSLYGCAYVEWRRSWLMTILEHHPSIWFGDEVRLQLAQDDYLVGNTEDCAARLRDLAEHGRPDVAAKAAELLAAMKAKGMLEAESP